MSNQRSTAPTIKLTKSSAISEVSRSDSIGINGLVDPSDSVVVKKVPPLDLCRPHLFSFSSLTRA